jgi:hypothetical protein
VAAGTRRKIDVGLFPIQLSRRAGLALLVLIGVTSTFGGALAAADEVHLLFVQNAPDVAVKGDELRLKNVNPATLFFSDRPRRMAGQLKLEEWQKLWTKGRDSLLKNPPNAVLSIFEPGKEDPSETVVELLDVKSDGPDLVYSIGVLKGTPPAAGGQSSLFIDCVTKVHRVWRANLFAADTQPQHRLLLSSKRSHYPVYRP